VTMKLYATVVSRTWGDSIGIVIPAEIRKKLDIKAGDTVQVRIEKIQ